MTIIITKKELKKAYFNKEYICTVEDTIFAPPLTSEKVDLLLLELALK